MCQVPLIKKSPAEHYSKPPLSSDFKKEFFHSLNSCCEHLNFDALLDNYGLYACRTELICRAAIKKSNNCADLKITYADLNLRNNNCADLNNCVDQIFLV